MYVQLQRQSYNQGLQFPTALGKLQCACLVNFSIWDFELWMLSLSLARVSTNLIKQISRRFQEGF